MKKSAFSHKYFFIATFALLLQFAMPEAFARPEYVGPTTGATGCANCHTSAVGTGSNIKPQAQAAFSKAGLVGLKNWIKCPAGTTLNTATYQCVAPAPVWKTVSGSVGKTTDGLRKTDIWAVTCPTLTSSLAISVRDLAPISAPVVSIQAVKSGASSALSKDAKDGDAVFSPTVKLAKGAGVYNVMVTKAASTVKGVELYSARFACLKTTGATAAMPVAPKLTQNQ